MARRLGMLGLAAALVAALGAGTWLRLAFPFDIEWKGDEQWSFFHARQMLAGGGWPPIGMPSSVGAPNPGLSVWVFAGIEALFRVKSPPDLAHAIARLNVAALVGFAGFGLFAVAPARREPWLWAAALWAVNPAAVVLERKIWPPSVLPLAAVAFLIAWRYRRHPAAAFAWGALGALMAQIHIGAAFFALAIGAWTLVRDGRAFPWKGWLAGAAIGALPALPWLMEVLRHGSHARTHLAPPAPDFYLRWPTQPFGWGADYVLRHHDFGRFLQGPMLGGAATWLMLAVQAGLVLLALLVAARAVLRAWRNGAPPLRGLFLGDSDETLLIAASLWGYGGLLTLVTLGGAGSYRHYMIVTTPVMMLWGAMVAAWAFDGAKARARAVLAALVVGQAALSAGLLTYIHDRGVLEGEFGATWRAQQGVAPSPFESMPLGWPPAR